MWPILEAKKLLKHLKKINFDQKNDICNFEMGFGPSGEIHLGTLMEAIRSNMVKKAFEYITNNEYNTRLICFSDDMDGLRKEINNILPDSKKYLGLPLSSIPDHENKYKSFADKMNNKLMNFLHQYNVDFELYTATEFYKSGKFNNGIQNVINNYDKIMKVMLPTLGEERQKTYSPILPICPETGKVLLVPIQIEGDKISYINDKGMKVTQSPFNGGCKLQWKIDFAMRWKELPIHFEMYGKEHNDNAHIYNKICRILNGIPPSQYVYEMLLNIDGSKLSKSKDNQSISIEEWLYLAPFESLILFMYNNPQRAKILHSSIIPKYVDEYITLNNQYHQLKTKEEQINSPIWHIHHDDNIPNINSEISFNMLINLSCSLNINDEEVFLKFINKHVNHTNHSDFFLSLLKFAIRYSNKFINKIFKTPDALDKEILNQLKTDLMDRSIESQKVLYNLARKFDISDTKSFFQNLYAILIGRDSGPRLGTFIDILGRNDFIELINSKLI